VAELDATSHTPLQAAPAWLDAAAIIALDRTWSWREVHAASMMLARQLPEAVALYNLCTSRLGFLTVWLAALRAGCTMILPPSSGAGDLAAMLAAHARSIVVVDQVALAQAHRKAGTSCLLLGPSAPGTPPPDAALAWDPDLERTAVVLHTSGSTGKPEPQPKSLR
jgi:acyl-CoA synthetase (AMP-forming)/AMP-acid ligase II